MPRSTPQPSSILKFSSLIQPSNQFLEQISPYTFPEHPSLYLQSVPFSSLVHHVSFLFCPIPRTCSPCGLPGFIRAPGRPPGDLQHARISFFWSHPINITLTRWRLGRAGPFLNPTHRFLANCCFLPVTYNTDEKHHLRDNTSFLYPFTLPDLDGAFRLLEQRPHSHDPSFTKLVKFIAELFLFKFSPLIPNMSSLRNTGNHSADTPAANAASAQQTGVSNSNE